MSFRRRNSMQLLTNVSLSFAFLLFVVSLMNGIYTGWRVLIYPCWINYLKKKNMFEIEIMLVFQRERSLI